MVKHGEGVRYLKGSPCTQWSFSASRRTSRSVKEMDSNSSNAAAAGSSTALTRAGAFHDTNAGSGLDFTARTGRAESNCRRGSEAVGPRPDGKARQRLDWSSQAARSRRQTAVMGVQMKVVAARTPASRTTSSCLRSSSMSARGCPSCGRARTGWGDVLPCWGSCKARRWVTGSWVKGGRRATLGARRRTEHQRECGKQKGTRQRATPAKQKVSTRAGGF